ncbi:hypothetical protein BAUCODRAFT_62221 [Baudoinia panamericana UAMH 10762]|uniref:Enoyl reductase (ER) domain-containing protein n=1 Tax=Baudoinia panamericana (strain UAMH 10762) TaxID=717646 RepID=M2MU16_BAUPA|nr:uncharacterized protein BAUCODRAFT_62221 [Baudoinia panamericana UAMH 10762]EMD00417.1 hypothetical protein BAUCODRAFT_62221 [Baudoinia panamericana UAMH 10762]
MNAVIKLSALGQAAFVRDRPVPQPRPGYILVKTKAVALNPIDWMQIDTFPAPNALLGRDYSGVIEAVGAGVTSTKFRKGDRVCGYVLGGDHLSPENGAFAEYVLAKAEVGQFHIPASMGFEEAATLGSAVITGMCGLYLKLGLQEGAGAGNGEFILIYGGSTASAAMGIQMAVRSGYTVITTCSPHNKSFVESLGAHHIFDYRSPDCAASIRELTADKLKYLWDTIATLSTAAFCAGVMSSEGGHYVSLLPSTSLAPAKFMDATQCLGEYFEYGPARLPVPVDPAAFMFMKARGESVEQMLEARELRPHVVEVGEGGLAGVLDGVDHLRKRVVSARKLVYRIEDTPVAKASRAG